MRIQTAKGHGLKWEWLNGKLFLGVGGQFFPFHIEVGPVLFAIRKRPSRS